MVVFGVWDRTQSWHLWSRWPRPTTARIKAGLSLWLLEATQLGPASNQGNFSFKLEVIWDTSWTYSRTVIWTLLFWRITNKWPLVILMEPVDNMFLPEDRWLHESSRSCAVCFSATSSVCVYISTGSFHVGILSRTGRRVYGGEGGGGGGFTTTHYKWTNWDPEMWNTFSRFTQLSRSET